MALLDREQGKRMVVRILSGETIDDSLRGSSDQDESSNSSSKLVFFAMAVALVLVASAGIGREMWNAGELAAQVEEADRQAELARESRAEAEKQAAEKTRFVENVRALSKRYLERTREELLRIREEPSDNVPGEPFASMRMAGEILRQGGIEDAEFWERYDGATNEILTRLAQYLKPGMNVEVVIVESKDGQP